MDTVSVMPWRQALLSGLILLAFARVTLLLGAQALWWDESLSLQRAEEGWLELIRGTLWITDGINMVPTTDQHPFFSFLLQGLLVRLAGNEEFVLRFVSVTAATLLVPVVWVLAQWLARRHIVPTSTPAWAALFAAVSPFMLWYGQEARPYALWAMLAVLTTYLLLRATEGSRINWPFAAGFVVTELMFVTTHYYAVFLLPLHAIIVFLWLVRRSLLLAIGLAGAVLLMGGAVAVYAAITILGQGGGQNFPSISLRILVPDLVNAFSLGLSVDLAVVWWIDLVFGMLALTGAIWGMRSRASIRRGGWILPAFILIPVGMLLILNLLRPLYMNARHMSLLVGAFVLLVSGGIGLLWQARRWLGGIVAACLLAATLYSTVNYFTVEEYAKDDYVHLGEYMDGRIMPGDVVLFYPPTSWRIFEYYLPLEPVHAAIAQGAPFGIYGVPLLIGDFDDTAAWLADLGSRYRRIWLIKSGTHPWLDLDGQVERWLLEHFLRVRDAAFHSHSSLHAQLFLPEIPVYEELPESVQQPVTVEFGDLVRLAGYTIEKPATADVASTARLYWQVLEKPTRRYKYRFQLVERAADGEERVLTMVEHEPYEGDIPTLYWDPGKTIMEWVELPPALTPAPDSSLFFTFQLYDAETQEKLPVTKAEGVGVAEDGATAILPFVEPMEYAAP